MFSVRLKGVYNKGPRKNISICNCEGGTSRLSKITCQKWFSTITEYHGIICHRTESPNLYVRCHAM